MPLLDDADFFQNLPSEIIDHINEFLDPSSRLRFSSTNQGHRGFLKKVAIVINQSHVEEVVATLQRNQEESNQNFLSKVEAIALISSIDRNNISKAHQLLGKLEIKKASCQHFNSESVGALAAALPHTEVQELDFISNRIGSEGAKAFASALPTTKI